MKNYTTFTLEDFAGDEEFRDWVQGQGNQNLFWQTFIAQHPEKAEIIRHAEWIIRSTNVEGERISEMEIKAEVTKFMRKVMEFNAKEASMHKPISGQRHAFFNQFKYWTAAAIVIIAIGFMWYSDAYPSRSIDLELEKRDNMVETHNESNNALRLILSDKSVVILSPRSKLRYPSEFGGSERKVYLSGEAGFSVTPMSKPFVVHAGVMVTKVLGTRFVVRAFENDKKNSVQVQSGKVSVYSDLPTSSGFKERRGVILTVNQAAIFEKYDQDITKTLVASPVVITKDNKIVNYFYDEIPLPEILEELEKGYGIPIQFNKESFNGCKITATLSNETLFEKLDMLTKIVSASYEIVDGQITITGTGCN
jgi:transmembrane sensor